MKLLSSLAAATDHYHLRYGPDQPDHVAIEAEFALSGDVIGMFVIASPQLPNGSADLVADLVVRDAVGSLSLPKKSIPQQVLSKIRTSRTPPLLRREP